MTVDERFERCYCTGVTREQALTAIQAGARTVEDLQRRTGACTGCGTCRWELEGLLAECAARRLSAPLDQRPPAP